MNTELNTVAANNKTARKLLCVFAIVFTLFSAVFLVFKRTDLFPWIGPCYPNSSSEHFLAYCHSVRFGDYEHFAYYHETEPEAISHLKSANVVFLGSSNTQFAFSTQSVKQFFNEAWGPHYVMGFGHGAQSGVAEAVAKKLQLAPKVWVVNADPFFTGEVNATFERVIANKPSKKNGQILPLWLQPNIHGEHERKRWLQNQQRARCDGTDEANPWCRGGLDTLHRNRMNGHWFVENYRDNLQLPVGEDQLAYLDKLDDYSTIANNFIEDLAIDRNCFIITATPRADTPINYAEEIAKNIGAPFVYPTVSDLKTIDGFHLDPDSSERWSAAFLTEAIPYLERCIH